MSFIETQGKELQCGHICREGFGKGLPQHAGLRCGEPNESAFVGSVKEGTECRSQLRCPLKFVDPNGWSVLPEKRVGVVLREVERLKVIEADVPTFARKALKEHLLSYPSHAGDQKALVTGVDLVEDLLQGSRKIVGVQ